MELILCSGSETVDNLQYPRGQSSVPSWTVSSTLVCACLWYAELKVLMAIHVCRSLVEIAPCWNCYSFGRFVGTGHLVNCLGRNVSTLYRSSQCDTRRWSSPYKSPWRPRGGIEAFSPLGNRPGTHFTGGWVGLRVGLGGCRKSRPHRDSIAGHPSHPRYPDPRDTINDFTS